MDKISENIIPKLIKLLNTKVSSETTIFRASNFFEIIKIFEKEALPIDTILDEYRNTALILAAANGNKEVVECLVTKGADKEAVNSYGLTALLLAAVKGNKEVVECLVTKGADKEAVNSYGDTALILAAVNGNREIVEYLVGNDADKEATDSNGITVLILAAFKGYMEIVKYLVDKGADKEAANNNGITALIAAAMKGHIKIVEYLVGKGANKEVVISNGNTALTLAENNGHREVVEYLLNTQANAYYTKVLSNVSAVLRKDSCPITQQEIKKPVFLRRSKNKSLYEISAIISWLYRHDTNPLTREKITLTREISRERLEGRSTREGIIPEKIHTERLVGQERLTYILRTALCYPMKPIIIFMKNSCRLLKRMAQGRNKYRAMILQKMIMDFRVKPVVNIQAFVRAKQIRFKYTKSRFISPLSPCSGNNIYRN